MRWHCLSNEYKYLKVLKSNILMYACHFFKTTQFPTKGLSVIHMRLDFSWALNRYLQMCVMLDLMQFKCPEAEKEQSKCK